MPPSSKPRPSMARLRFQRWFSIFPSKRNLAKALILERKAEEKIAKLEAEARASNVESETKKIAADVEKTALEAKKMELEGKKAASFWLKPIWSMRLGRTNRRLMRANSRATALAQFPAQVKKRNTTLIELARLERESSRARVVTKIRPKMKRIARQLEKRLAIAERKIPRNQSTILRSKFKVARETTLASLTTPLALIEFENTMRAIEEALAKKRYAEAGRLADLLLTIAD